MNDVFWLYCWLFTTYRRFLFPSFCIFPPSATRLQCRPRRLYIRRQTRLASHGTRSFKHTAIPFCIHFNAGRRSQYVAISRTLLLCPTICTDPNPLELPPSALAQPIPFDADGQMRINLLGLQSGSSQLRVWKNVWNASDPSSTLYEV